MVNNCETVCIIGNIYTCCDDMPRAEAAVIEDGAFAFVGSAEAARAFAPDARVVTFESGIVLPGFIDGHTHAFGGKMSELYMAHLNEASSLAEYGEIVAQFVAAHPEYDVYLGMGWSNGMFDGHVPTAQWLDRIESDKPVIIQSGDWHAYWVNSAALRAAHIDRNTASPAGGKIERDAAGNPNGCLRETAMNLMIPIIPRLTLQQYKTAILAVQDMFLRLGITAYMDMVLNFDASHEVFDAYAALDAENELKMDVFGGYLIDSDDDPDAEIARACELRSLCAFHRFKLTDIKIFVDGVVEGGTGFLLEPFETDTSYHGENRWADAESQNDYNTSSKPPTALAFRSISTPSATPPSPSRSTPSMPSRKNKAQTSKIQPETHSPTCKWSRPIKSCDCAYKTSSPSSIPTGSTKNRATTKSNYTT